MQLRQYMGVNLTYLRAAVSVSGPPVQRQHQRSHPWRRQEPCRLQPRYVWLKTDYLMGIKVIKYHQFTPIHFQFKDTCVLWKLCITKHEKLDLSVWAAMFFSHELNTYILYQWLFLNKKEIVLHVLFSKDRVNMELFLFIPGTSLCNLLYFNSMAFLFDILKSNILLISLWFQEGKAYLKRSKGKKGKGKGKK